jgi:hypothetical protein
VSAKTWYVETVSGRQIVVETVPQEVSTDTYAFEVVMGPEMGGPATGMMVHGAICQLLIQESYCPASVIELEIQPAEVLGDAEALLGDPAGRMLRKMEQVVPIHVRTLDVAYVTRSTAAIGITATTTVEQTTESVAPLVMYFDELPADEFELDGGSIVAEDTVTITGP